VETHRHSIFETVLLAMQKCKYFVFSTLTKLVLQEKRENVLCPFGIISFGRCYRAIGNGVLEIHVILVIIIRRYEWDIKPFGFFANTKSCLTTLK
jgi:hypothetical protein